MKLFQKPQKNQRQMTGSIYDSPKETGFDKFYRFCKLLFLISLIPGCYLIGWCFWYAGRVTEPGAFEAVMTGLFVICLYYQGFFVLVWIVHIIRDAQKYSR